MIRKGIYLWLLFFTFSVNSNPVHEINNKSLSTKRRSDRLSAELIDLNSLRLDLNKKIKALARSKLNIPKKARFKFRFTYFNIENWPKFVSFRFNNWDMEAIKAIGDSLPLLKFTVLTDEEATKKVKDKNSYHREINALLNDRFKLLIGKTKILIKWNKYNIKGWPVGFRNDLIHIKYLNLSEMRKIYLGIQKITFFPKLSKEEAKTVTYAEEALTDSDAITTSKCSKQKQSISDNLLVHKTLNSNNLNRDLNEQRFEAYQIIKSHAMNQLNISDRLSVSFEFNLNHYKIINWPDFISFNWEDWDEQSINDIQAVISDLVFIETVQENRISILNDLLSFECSKIKYLLCEKIYNQIDSDERLQEISSWSKYYLKGWPVGVSNCSINSKFSRPEMLAISRAIKEIIVVPIQERLAHLETSSINLDSSLVRKRKFSNSDSDISESCPIFKEQSDFEIAEMKFCKDLSFSTDELNISEDIFDRVSTQEFVENIIDSDTLELFLISKLF